jgi:uncharacterized protein YtpQ (UPF0354 family)
MKKIAFLLMILFCQLSIAEELLSEDEFVELYIKAVQKKVVGIKAEKKDQLEVHFENNEGEEQISFLNNAYISYTNSPESLEDIIKQYTGSLEELFQPKEINFGKTQIFPVIKNRDYISQVETMFREKGSDAPFPFYFEQLNEELYVLYVFDTETSMRYISQKDIDKLQIKNEELRTLAKENLRSSIELQIQGNPASLSMLLAGGNYEASFILYDSLWNKEQFPVKGDIIVYIPSRDLVLVTGSEDAEGLKQVRSIVYDPENEWPHIVSEKGFVRKGDAWEVLSL